MKIIRTKRLKDFIQAVNCKESIKTVRLFCIPARNQEYTMKKIPLTIAIKMLNT